MTRRFEARTLTDDDVARLRSAEGRVGQEAIVVRPNRDNSGISAMDEVLTSMPRTHKESKGGRFSFRGGEEQVPAPFSFEMRYAPDPITEGGKADDRVLSLQYLGGDAEIDQRLGRQLQDRYSDSRIERQPASFLSPSPGQSMGVCTLGLRRYTLYPLKNSQLDEFTTDPTGAILSEMVGMGEDAGDDADVAVQIMCRPAGIDWRDGVPGGFGLADQYGEGLDADEQRVTSPHSTQELRWFLNQPTRRVEPLVPRWLGGNILKHYDHPLTRDVFEHPPSKADKAVAKMLSDLDGRGWELYFRIVAVSDDPDIATSRVRMVAEMFDNFYEYRGRQNFLPVPFTGEDAVDCAAGGFAREWPDDSLVPQRIIKPQIEAACLTNVPEEEHVSTGKFRWSLSKPGEGVPPGTPRFDFEDVDISRDATKEEKQLALIESSGDESPFWYGLGVRQGVEAGSYTDLRNPHMFLVGESGVGKTTFIANRKAQEFTRSCGGLHIDPNGDDTAEWMSEWPDDKPPEDCIYIDLSGEHERIPRFNFLEMPSYLERGTRQYNEFVEKLAEDIVDMIRAAGGTDKYMGSRMKRVAKNVLRAMVRVMDNWDVTATLFDFAAVCSSQENLSKFSENMPESELEYLRDRVHSHAELSDGDLDALAGRLDEWVLNPNVRELICARDPSFSVEDAVTEARHIFVQMSDSGTDVVKRMFGGALITRTYFAQRFHRPDHDFHMTCDEAQTVITASCDIENIMDQGRKFDYSVTLACQRPDSQFSDEIRSAVTGNAATTIAYGLGNDTEAGAVEDQFRGVDSSDLANMSKFRFYMATETEEGLETDGYLVEAFRAPSEAREMVADMNADGVENGQAVAADGGQSVEELQGASLDIYGTTVDDADLEASPFKGGTSGSGEGDESGIYTEQRERSLLAVLFGCSINQPDPDAPVPSDTLIDALDAEPTIDLQNNHLDTLIQRANSRGTVDVSPDGSGVEMADDGAEVLWDSGTSGNAGKLSHQVAVEHIARGLSDEGYTARVPRQTGEEMPDLYATLPVEPGGATYEEAKAARDTLKDDYENLWELSGESNVAVEFEKATLSAPAQIAHNLRKAVTADDPDHVLFVVNQGEPFADFARKLTDKLSEPMLTVTDSRTPNDVYRKFYHQDTRLLSDRDSPQVAVPADGTYQWVGDDEGAVILRLSTDDGYEEIARFDSLAEWRDRSADDFPVTFAVDDDGVAVSDGRADDLCEYPDEEAMTADYSPVFAPFVPEEQFGGELPESDAWDIAVLPNDDSIPLQVYDADADDCWPLPKLAEYREGDGASDESNSTAGDSDTSDDEWDEDIWSDENW